MIPLDTFLCALEAEEAPNAAVPGKPPVEFIEQAGVAPSPGRSPR